MPIIFSDEDLMNIGKEQDNQLRSIMWSHNARFHSRKCKAS
jgi:hypothetical protein